MKAIPVAVAAALAAASPSLAEVPQAPRPIEIMILGSFHMANPGNDLVNMKADDVTQPKRQAELQALTAALARWRPTKVMVEFQAPPPFTLSNYRSFTPAQLSIIRNEVWQIGFRLARQLGHQEVYGFDQQGTFGFDRVQAWAAAHGRSQELDQIVESQRATAAVEGQALLKRSIVEQLLPMNDPVRQRSDHERYYYGLLRFGDADEQVGAELNANWYARNARMFARISLIAQPGDRVLVLVGAGHLYWLTHFAETTPGYISIDPRPYLRRAAKPGRPRR